MEFLKKHKLVLIIIILLFIAISSPFLFIVYEKYKPYYYAEDFNIKTIKSSIDANNNGIDDYMDILLGAREDAKNIRNMTGDIGIRDIRQMTLVFVLM